MGFVLLWVETLPFCQTRSFYRAGSPSVSRVCVCMRASALFPWILKCRAALGSGLVSMDNSVRRGSAQALGELARLGGNTFAKNLVASIQKQLQDGIEGA